MAASQESRIISDTPNRIEIGVPEGPKDQTTLQRSKILKSLTKPVKILWGKQVLRLSTRRTAGQHKPSLKSHPLSAPTTDGSNVYPANSIVPQEPLLQNNPQTPQVDSIEALTTNPLTAPTHGIDDERRVGQASTARLDPAQAELPATVRPIKQPNRNLAQAGSSGRNANIALTEKKKEEEEIFAGTGGLADNWLRPLVKSKLESLQRGGLPVFNAILVDADASKNSPNKRAMKIRITLGEPSLCHARDIEKEVTKKTRERYRRGFEIEIIEDATFKYVASIGILPNQWAHPDHSLHISFAERGTTLCGSLIGVESLHSQSLVWTLGGLVSVRNRIYGLSVAHPYESRSVQDVASNNVPTARSREDDSTRTAKSTGDHPSAEQHFQDSRYMGQSHTGVIKALALSDSKFVPDNCDWMLVNIEKAALRPNIDPEPEMSKKLTFPLDESYCLIATYRGGIEASIVPGHSYVTMGQSNFRTITARLSEPLLPGDSGSWVFRIDDEYPIGVAIAASNFDGPTAFIVEMHSIFSTISEAFGGAQTRLLASTENEILKFRHQHPDKKDATHLWPLYLNDLLRRHERGLDSIQSAALIANDLPHVNSEFHALLVIGQTFPFDQDTKILDVPKGRLSRFALSNSNTSRSTMLLVSQLKQYQAGTNFLMLLAALGRLSGKVNEGLASSREFAVEVVRYLFSHTDLPPSTKPSDALIGELFDLQAHHMRWFASLAIPDELDRILKYTSPVSSIHLAEILAKAHFAWTQNCFFVCTVNTLGHWQYLLFLLSLMTRPLPISSLPWQNEYPVDRWYKGIREWRPEVFDVPDRFPRVIVERVYGKIPPQDTAGHLIGGSELYDGIWSPLGSDRTNTTIPNDFHQHRDDSGRQLQKLQLERDPSKVKGQFTMKERLDKLHNAKQQDRQSHLQSTDPVYTRMSMV